MWNFNKSKGYIYYIGNQNDIIGYCLLDDSNTIRGFFIKNEYRNLGLGTKLLQHVINENCSKTIVVNINKPAVNVYTKLGFKILGERRDFNLLIGYYGDLDNELKTKLYNKLK